MIPQPREHVGQIETGLGHLVLTVIAHFFHHPRLLQVIQRLCHSVLFDKDTADVVENEPLELINGRVHHLLVFELAGLELLRVFDQSQGEELLEQIHELFAFCQNGETA